MLYQSSNCPGTYQRGFGLCVLPFIVSSALHLFQIATKLDASVKQAENIFELDKVQRVIQGAPVSSIFMISIKFFLSCPWLCHQIPVFANHRRYIRQDKLLRWPVNRNMEIEAGATAKFSSFARPHRPNLLTRTRALTQSREHQAALFPLQ